MASIYKPPGRPKYIIEFRDENGRRRRFDAVDFLEIIAQFDGLGDRQRHNLVAQVFNVRGPGATITFSH